MLRIGTRSSESDLILDFFAGSGSTGDAVMQLNAEDGGNRKYILVQLPERTGAKDYPTIADITKARLRAASKAIGEISNGTLPGMPGNTDKVDLGFKVFKLDESNFWVWDAAKPQDTATLEEQLALHIDHVRPNRTEMDILYEILLKCGFPLTMPIEKITLEGKVVHSIAGGGLLICLEKSLTLALIRAMASQGPARVVCLDLGFAGNDQLKTNAVQIFKTKNIVFRTV
jgi:adenine-specific DNA-methyltransferase